MAMTETTKARVSAVQESKKAANRRRIMIYLALLAVALIAPFLAYPVFLMKILCFALFASAFNLVLGYTGLLSFGHAAFLATGGYFTGYLKLGARVSQFFSGNIPTTSEWAC